MLVRARIAKKTEAATLVSRATAPGNSHCTPTHQELLSAQNARLRDRIQWVRPWSVRASRPGNSHCTPIAAGKNA